MSCAHYGILSHLTASEEVDQLVGTCMPFVSLQVYLGAGHTCHKYTLDIYSDIYMDTS